MSAAQALQRGPRLLPRTAFAVCAHEDVAGWDRLPPGARTRRKLDDAAGRMAAAIAMQNLCGRSAPVGRAPDGAPVWPEGITGAISHSGGRAVALLGDARHHLGLGVDLETLSTRPDQIAAQILRPAELERLGAHTALHVTLAFSAKESLFKALYPRVGKLFGFDAAELVSLGDGNGQLRLREALGPWPQAALFRFSWTQWGGQVLTALSAPYARSVAPPST